MLGKIFQSFRKVLEWAAQEGSEVTVPAGVQETFRCCTEGCGLVWKW